MKSITKFVLILAFSFLSLSCRNMLEDVAKKDTNAALLHAAKLLMNASDWTGAIDKFGEMTADYVAKREVKSQHAKAYAGRCGLELMQMISDLASNLATTNLFLIFMQSMQGATTTNIDDCIQAEAIMYSIAADPADRTENENLNLAFISFAKMGAILAAYADETLPDGVPDVGFDSCADNAAPGLPNTPTAYAGHVATGFNHALKSLEAVLAGGGTVGNDELTLLDSACTAIESYAPAYNFCDVFDPSALDANQLKGIRTVIQDGNLVGIGSCGGASLAACACL